MYDRYESASGMREVKVPQENYHGPEVFESEDELMRAIPAFDLDVNLDYDLATRRQNEPAQDPPYSPSPSPPPSPLLPEPEPNGRFARRVWIAESDEDEEETGYIR
ncbi:hypothetical protein FRC10_010973 [Ceratobasidium sp. 414]|nr:hypothetical protein FRC10_010973 [Ceratobasidium sp. 414]